MSILRRPLALVAVAAVVSGVALDRPAPASTLPPPQRVAILGLENRSFEQVIGNPQAPFLNRRRRHQRDQRQLHALRHRAAEPC